MLGMARRADRICCQPTFCSENSELMHPFHLQYGEFRRLSRRARHAQRANQFEVVGLLAVSPSKPRILRLVFLRNHATEPCQWELRGEDIKKCRRTLRANGFRSIGLFHSHPLTYATLGPRDRRNTPSGWYHLVYDVCALDPRLYVVRRRNGRRRVDEIPLTVERSTSGTSARGDLPPAAERNGQ